MTLEGLFGPSSLWGAKINGLFGYIYCLYALGLSPLSNKSDTFYTVLSNLVQYKLKSTVCVVCAPSPLYLNAIPLYLYCHISTNNSILPA